MPFEWNTLIGPAVVAALVAGVVTVIGFLMNRSTLLTMHGERIATDAALAERRSAADIALAERKLALDRSLEEWRRRTEFAEQVLADFYKARDIFAAARSPMSSGGEGNTRPPREGESEDDARYRNALYAPFERLAKERDFLSEMQARRYRFMALFGNSAGEPFLTFVRTYHSIANATFALIDDRRSLNREIMNRYEARIWTMGDDDPVNRELDHAVTTVEGLCAPAIQAGPA